MKTMKQIQFNDLKSVQDKVEFLLKNNPEAVESDRMLVSIYWLNEIKDTVDNLSGTQVLMMIGSAKLTSPATIIRKRQLIQKNDESLRGALYGTRKKVQHNFFKVRKTE